MTTTTIDSTTLAAVGYAAGRQLLLVEFRDRTVYQYFGVPEEVHTGLLGSPSKGAYFNRMIRGRYTYLRGTVAEENL